ncbi:hypothetical protein EXU57_08310 [Segetibacter sp. 3557_3]|uniref:hypothetical protein n=1 Tax=Segetibacter sp. 3557_3 TaxID=2547429 RepID=UPI0010590754|nr:hypothetical protein [Segetibacter sp. 3557_3]TDH26804.1 hypothetical protein EXU57_08310 [Segetibacter sp. 3557_3]
MLYRQLLLMLCAGIILAGCSKKRLDTNDCEQLKTALATENLSMVKKELNGQLTAYSKENLTKLTATLLEKCNINAAPFCYDCIKTNPAQTEIQFSFAYQGTVVHCNVDFSKTSNNRMEVVGVHR